MAKKADKNKTTVENTVAVGNDSRKKGRSTKEKEGIASEEKKSRKRGRPAKSASIPAKKESSKKSRLSKVKDEPATKEVEGCQDNSSVVPSVEALASPVSTVNQESVELLRSEISALSRECDALRDERDFILGEVSILRMLMVSFNALIRDGKVDFVKPVMKTPYFYLRAMPVGCHFDVIPCIWIDGKSDHYRYASGNMFLDEEVAIKACSAVNEFLNFL